MIKKLSCQNSLIKIMLALPTCSSEDKINYFLDNIKEEISKLGDSDYDISILVYINGKGAKEKKEEILFKGNAEIIVIADDTCIGKNDAMKSIHLEDLAEEKTNTICFKISLDNGQFSHQIVLKNSIIDNVI